MFPESDTRTDETRTYERPVGEAEQRGSRWSTLVTALAMLLLGVGMGWLLFANPADDSDVAAPDTTAAADEDPAPSEESPSSAEEPVAAVAEALLPSVVQIQTPTGEGSGVIYDANGFILTAAHVVAGRETVAVRLSDGSQYEGTVLGGDVATDIAVVEVDATGLPAAPLAVDGDLQVGQLAVAIGSPFGLDSTVTSGVVSALNQTVGRGGNFQSLIQTDAAINPGNSGGPLANRDGEVIGINVSIFSTSGGNVGVGFAVPIDVASDLAQAVVEGEPIERAVLGVTGTNTESGTAGALVTGVVEGSGAAEAGIQVGDAIVAVEGVQVKSIGDLVAQLGTYNPGDTVTLEIIRAGEAIEVQATLGSHSQQ